MAKVISFSNAKGGVGKSTFTAALSSIKASHGKKVLAIDLDGQCNLTKLFLSDAPESKEDTVYRTVIKGEELPVFSADQVDNLDIVPAHKILSEVSENAWMVLKGRIDQIKDRYDFIFIDCPPALDYRTKSAYGSSDLVVVVMPPGGWELDGLSDVSLLINSIKEHNPALNMLIGRNRYDTDITKKTTRIAVRMTDNALHDNEYYRDHILTNFIPEDTRAGEAQLRGMDVFSFDRTCKASKAFVRLAEELSA